MKLNIKTVGCGLLLGALSGPLFAHGDHNQGYWNHASGKPLFDGFGGCVRTIDFDKDNGLAECGDAMAMQEEKPMMVADADNDGVADANDNCPGTTAGAFVNEFGCEPDDDLDGVANIADQCPSTAAGVSVGANGCMLDADADGIADNLDQCPDSVRGDQVDFRGCARDRDGDGVADTRDQCPNTLAGIAVDSIGCMLDEDKDGIADASDQCPGSAPGMVVDTTGCELKEDISIDDVLFTTGTAQMDANSMRELDDVARVLVANPHLNFEVSGHTDNTGNYDRNVELSERRAESVRQYLVDQGVEADRLTARGYGPDRPRATNETRAGRSENRRVELNLK